DARKPTDTTNAGRATAAGVRVTEVVLPGRADVLRLDELEHTFVGTFTAQAALLHPTERRRRIGDEPAVDPQDACLDGFRRPQGTAEVTAEDVRSESELGAVRELDRLVVAA